MRKLLSLTIFCLGLAWSVQAQNTVYLDSNITLVTSVYLNQQGKAKIALDTNTYNTKTDSVYFSKDLFTCANIGMPTPIVITITDTTFIIPLVKYLRSTLVNVYDTLPPKVIVKSAYTSYLDANGQTKIKFNHINNGTWDSCGVDYSQIFFTPDSTFDCSHIGGFKSVKVHVPDVYGNIDSTKNILISITDTIEPNLVLKTDTFFLNNTQTNPILFTDLATAYSDNCAIDSAQLNGSNALVFDCNDVGLQKIIVQLFDVNGNQNKDSVEVYIADTNSTTYTKSNLTVYLNPDSVVVKKTDFLSNLVGQCKAPMVVLYSDTVFKCNAVLTNPNYLKFKVDQQTLDSVMVTVLDTVSPKLTTITTVANVGSTYNDSVSFNDLNFGSSDNCALDSGLINGVKYFNFGCADVGWHKVEVQLFDLSGNSSTDSVKVLVTDTTSIKYTKNNVTAYLNPTTAIVSRANYLTNVLGGCNILTTTIISDTVFNCQDLSSVQYIKFSISDGITVKTDSAMITVLDTLKPQLNLLNSTLYLDQNLQAQLVFSNIDNNSSDNCSLDSALLNHGKQVDFNCTHLGINKVYVQLFDLSGNQAADTVEVSVVDTNKIFYSKTPTTVYLNPTTAQVSRGNLLNVNTVGCATTLSFLNDTVFNCSHTASNPNYVKFQFNGILTDSVAVTVLDTVSPTLQLKADTLYLNKNFTATLKFAQIDQGSSDNCALDSATLNGKDSLVYQCSDTGNFNVQVKLYDVNGNAKTEIAQIRVLDTNSVAYTVNNFTAYLLNNTVSVGVNDVTSGISGSCNPPTFTFLSDTLFTCNDVNSNPHWVKFSINGQPTDSAMVTVLDTVKPMLNLQNTNVYLDQNLQAQLTFSNVDNGSNDNCALDSALINGTNKLIFDCSQLGLSKIYVELFDVNGNTNSDSVEITVLDTNTLSYATHPQTVYLNPASATLSRTQFITINKLACLDTLALLSDTIFNCSQSSSNPNYVKFKFNNTFSDSVAVTVLDTISPILMVKSDTFYLDQNYRVAVRFEDLDQGSFDNCALDSATLNGLDSLIYSCGDTGNFNIQIKLYDVNGNSTSATALIRVLDTNATNYTLNNYTAYLVGTEASVGVSDISTGIVGSCNPPSFIFLSDTLFDCLDVMSTPNYLKFSIDGQPTDSVIVTVLDTAKPDLKIKIDTIFLDQNYLATVDFNAIDNGSYDNCSIDSATLNGSNVLNFSCTDTGIFTLQVELFDVSGNASSELLAVYVVDTNKTVYTTTPVELYLGYTAVEIEPTDFLNFSAGCTLPKVSLLSDSVFSCNNVYANTQYLKFEVDGFNVDSVAVNVYDTLAPNIALKADTFFLSLTTNSVDVSFASLDQGTVDNCGLDSATVNGAQLISFSCADTGLQKIVVTAFDLNGNQSQDSIQVYISDTVSNYTKMPYTAYINGINTSIHRANIITGITANCSMPTFNFLSDTIFDCSAVSTNPNYVKFQIGLSPIDSVAVTILDTASPKLNLTPVTVYLDQNFTASVNFTEFNAGSFDNCGLDSGLVNGLKTMSFTCADTGVNIVNIQLFDINGNSAQNIAAVFVEDTVTPNYVAVSQTVFLNPNNATVSRSQIFTTSNGNCQSPGILFLTDTVFDCSNIGLNPNYIKFNIYGILDSVAVTVLDTVKPVAILKPQPVEVFLDNQTGLATVSFLDLVTQITDNCAMDANSYTVTPNHFSCSDFGIQTVTITATDVNNNTISKEATIDVKGSSSTNSAEILGNLNPCQNSYNVKYILNSIDDAATYNWTVDGGQIISTSFKGREIYVHWNFVSKGKITVNGQNSLNCNYYTDTVEVNLGSRAPDTISIAFWNDSTQNTLVAKGPTFNAYQWGYDFYDNNIRKSTALNGETKSYYYTADLKNNINQKGYLYWCEVTDNNQCWTRSYLNNKYPVNLDENLDLNSVMVYPNPFSESLNIKADKKIESIEVYNLFGQIVYRKNQINNFEFNLTDKLNVAESSLILVVKFKDGAFYNTKITHTK